jgi:hypothetical protein
VKFNSFIRCTPAIAAGVTTSPVDGARFSGNDWGVNEGPDYPEIAEIQLAVEKAAGCPAKHIDSVVWEGEVEVFQLESHPKAKRAYGWRNWEGDFTAVLEILPVDSPTTAVKVAIAAKARE